MGRKINADRTQDILKTVADNDCQLRAAGVAKLLGLHPQEVSRSLTSLEDNPEKYLYEDDKGFLGVFRLK